MLIIDVILLSHCFYYILIFSKCIFLQENSRIKNLDANGHISMELRTGKDRTDTWRERPAAIKKKAWELECVTGARALVLCRPNWPRGLVRSFPEKLEKKHNRELVDKIFGMVDDAPIKEPSTPSAASPLAMQQTPARPDDDPDLDIDMHVVPQTPGRNLVADERSPAAAGPPVAPAAAPVDAADATVDAPVEDPPVDLPAEVDGVDGVESPASQPTADVIAASTPIISLNQLLQQLLPVGAYWNEGALPKVYSQVINPQFKYLPHVPPVQGGSLGKMLAQAPGIWGVAIFKQVLSTLICNFYLSFVVA